MFEIFDDQKCIFRVFGVQRGWLDFFQARNFKRHRSANGVCILIFLI